MDGPWSVASSAPTVTATLSWARRRSSSSRRIPSLPGNPVSWVWPWYLDTTSFLLRCKERAWRGLPISEPCRTCLSVLIKPVTDRNLCVCVAGMLGQGLHIPFLEQAYMRSGALSPPSTTWMSRTAKGSLTFEVRMGNRLNLRSTGPRMGPSVFPPTQLLQNCGRRRGVILLRKAHCFPLRPGNTEFLLSWGQRKDLGPQGEQGRRQRPGPLHSIGEKVPLGSGTELWGLARKSGLMR